LKTKRTKRRKGGQQLEARKGVKECQAGKMRGGDTPGKGPKGEKKNKNERKRESNFAIGGEKRKAMDRQRTTHQGMVRATLEGWFEVEGEERQVGGKKN